MFFIRSEWSWEQSRLCDHKGDRATLSDGWGLRTELSNWQGKYCRCRLFIASVWTRSSPSSPFLWVTGMSNEVPFFHKTRALSSSNKMPRGSCCRWPSIDRHDVAILNHPASNTHRPNLVQSITNLIWKGGLNGLHGKYVLCVCIIRQRNMLAQQHIPFSQRVYGLKII